MYQRLLIALALLIGISAPGCEALPIVGPVVSGYVYWVNGEAHAYYKADANTTYLAVKRSVKELGYTITDEQQDGTDYSLSVDANDRFAIKIKQTESNISEVCIRVNLLGDKPLAELIYKEITKQLDVVEFPEAKRRRLLHRH